MKRRELLKGLSLTAGALISNCTTSARADADPTTALSSNFATPVRALVRRHERLFQPVILTLPFIEAAEAIIAINNEAGESSMIRRDGNTLEVLVQPVDAARQITISFQAGDAIHEQTIYAQTRSPGSDSHAAHVAS